LYTGCAETKYFMDFPMVKSYQTLFELSTGILARQFGARPAQEVKERLLLDVQK
jgi:hypothetical protein